MKRTTFKKLPLSIETVDPEEKCTLLEIIGTGELVALIIRLSNRNINLQIEADSQVIYNCNIEELHEDSEFGLNTYDLEYIYIAQYKTSGNKYLLKLKFDRAYYGSKLGFYIINNGVEPAQCEQIGMVIVNEIL